MIESWRWYGPKDNVSLDDIAQAGATDIVTALHHIPNGEVWTKEEIRARQEMIAAKNLRWSVVESVPVHEAIKTRSGDFQKYIENYAQTLRNLGECGIHIVCYNFMPVLDWTRTDLGYELPNGARALRFDQVDFAAFELYILQRKDAEKDYSEAEQREAKQRFEQMTEADKEKLVRTIIMGLPGAEESYTLEKFGEQLARYENVDAAQLRANLIEFLKAVTPAAEEAGMKLAIHPDDPPRPILGLPRVMSTIDDMRAIREAVPSEANGFTFCTGSYGVRSDNDLCQMAGAYAPYIYFAHFRATVRDKDNPLSFCEGEHLKGDVDMYAMMKCLLTEERRRGAEIPVRPDHGHQILDDLRKEGINPGYTAIGRLKGLAELRGLALGITRSLWED